MILVCLALGASAVAAPSWSPTQIHELRRMMALMDYIGGDYSGAVRGGRVVATTEYAEMQNFSRALRDDYTALSDEMPADRAVIDADLKRLGRLIDEKADVSDVRRTTKALRENLLRISGLSATPQQVPDFRLAQTAFAGSCVSCHGADGHGNGPAVSPSMAPPPRNFHDHDVMDAASPFKFYNILPIGVDNTAMPAFSDLSERERWSLSFFLSGLRYLPAGAAGDTTWNPGELWKALDPSDRAAVERAAPSLEFLARTSDEDLLRWIKTVLRVGQPEKVLAALRVSVPFAAAQDLAGLLTQKSGGGATPAGRDVSQTFAHLDRLVAQARVFWTKGDSRQARDALLEAYLSGFEPLEPTLRVSNPREVAEVERLFLLAQNAALSPQADFSAAHLALVNALANVKTALQQDSSHVSAWGVMASSLVIVLREGFEAFLIIAAILALLKNLGAKSVARWIHLGWLSAVVAGLLTYWVFSQFVQWSGAHRESVEALTTATASLVLFYVSYWLLSQSEKRSWEKFIRAKTSDVLSSGKIGALFSLAFVAVYREAAETALFYHALSAGAPVNARWGILTGFLVGSLLLATICGGIMRFGLKLPLRRFFFVTSLLMMFISIVLVGKAVNACIEAGIVRPTVLALMPRIDLLGIYPVLETLLAQIILGMFALGLALWIKYRRPMVSRA